MSSLSPALLILGSNHQTMNSFSTLLSSKGKEWLHEVFCGQVQWCKYFEREYELSLGLAAVKSKETISLFIEVGIIVLRDRCHYFD